MMKNHLVRRYLYHGGGNHPDDFFRFVLRRRLSASSSSSSVRGGGGGGGVFRNEGEGGNGGSSSTAIATATASSQHQGQYQQRLVYSSYRWNAIAATTAGVVTGTAGCVYYAAGTNAREEFQEGSDQDDSITNAYYRIGNNTGHDYGSNIALCDSSSSSRSGRSSLNVSEMEFPVTVAIPTREEQLQKLQTPSPHQQLDVLIIGGGATGAGAALDGALRGLNVALIDRGDFGTETSSKSTKLIWAGIKYIATAISSFLRIKNVFRPIEALSDFKSELDMVLGCHRERRMLLENNPHLTNWVPIAIPFSSWIATPPPFHHPLFALAPMVMPAVVKVYDGMGNFACPASHVMTKSRALRKFPQLTENIKYCQIWYEGQHNDARTNTCIALTAAEEGATICNYVEMTSVIRSSSTTNSKNTGKAIGVMCRDVRQPKSKEFPIYAKSIIFAGGPFTDSLRDMEPEDEHEKAIPAVAAGGGTHIVLPHNLLPGGIGMLDMNTSDSRFLFFLPWEGHTLVGTTDRKGDPATSYPGPPEQEIQWLLEEVSKYLADDVKIRRSDVLSAWQGFRPLASDPHAAADAPVSRDHIISTNPETGITFITGGKWTTYREMAEDVITKVIELNDLKPLSSESESEKEKSTKPNKTETRPLRGGVGYSRNLPITLVQEYGISEDSAKHLCRTYGMNALDVARMAQPTEKRWGARFGRLLIEGFPYLECEIPYICRNEMVCSVKDVLTLRTRLAYLNKEAAIAAAPKVAELMAKEMNWSRREKKRQLQEGLDELDKFGGSIPNDPKYIATMERSVKNVRDIFNQLDLNHNGYIDITEFKDGCKLLDIPFSTHRDAMKVFNAIDRNGDGRIAEDEFMTWWQNSHSNLFHSNFHSKLANQFKFTTDSASDGSPGGGGILG